MNSAVDFAGGPGRRRQPTSRIPSLTALTLMGSHELDSPLAVPVVVVICNRFYAESVIGFGDERPAGLVGPKHSCTEQGFGICVDVAGARPR